MMKKARARLALKHRSIYLENRIRHLIQELRSPVEELQELSLFHFPYSPLLDFAHELGKIRNALVLTDMNELMEPKNA